VSETSLVPKNSLVSKQALYQKTALYQGTTSKPALSEVEGCRSISIMKWGFSPCEKAGSPISK
jgi:hypothetical protein